MKLAVVYNPRSGSALPKQQLLEVFSAAHITVEQLIDITAPTAQTTIKAYAVPGSVVAAIGGDGTVASVAACLADTKAVLAPLPGGTLNHFTKDLHIAQSLDEAVRNISSAQQRTVDVAMVNGRPFLNNSSIGIYPSSLNERKRFEDRLGKWPAAIVASIRAFLQFKLYTVTIDGNTFKTPFIFVGNNIYHLEHGAERRRLDEGTLCVYAIRSTKRRTLFRMIAAVLVRRLHQQDNFEEYYGKTVTIQAKRPVVHISTDGEVHQTNTPLTYELHADGLIII